MMTPGEVERTYEQIKRHLGSAQRHQQAEAWKQMRGEAETAAALFQRMRAEAGDPMAMLDGIRKAMESFGYSDEECDALLSPPHSPTSMKKSKGKKPKKDDKTGTTKPGPAKAPTLGYNPPPKTLPGFPKARRVPGKTPMGGKKTKKKKYRRRWKNDDGDILEWDYQHGKIERYDDKGKHKGEYDPNTGKQTKPAKPGRTITPTIITPMKGKMVYYLTWFAKEGDKYMGEALLPDVSEANVRSVFGLEPEEPPGDCLEVEQEQVEWLSEAAKGVSIRLDLFDYFVEACQP